MSQVTITIKDEELTPGDNRIGIHIKFTDADGEDGTDESSNTHHFVCRYLLPRITDALNAAADQSTPETSDD